MEPLGASCSASVVIAPLHSREACGDEVFLGTLDGVAEPEAMSQAVRCSHTCCCAGEVDFACSGSLGSVLSHMDTQHARCSLLGLGVFGAKMPARTLFRATLVIATFRLPIASELARALAERLDGDGHERPRGSRGQGLAAVLP